MTIEKIIKFRQALAEQGTELTIDQAKELYKSASHIIRRSKKLSQADLWEMEEVEIEGMTQEEKQQAISLYQHIRNIK